MTARRHPLGTPSPGRATVLAGLLLLPLVAGCGATSLPLSAARLAVDTTLGAAKLGYQGAALGVTTAYRVGQLASRMTPPPAATPPMDGLPVREAIRQGRIKNAPYTVHGNHYAPMSVAQAASYRESGTASWYGHETLYQPGGGTTANGERFDPYAATAAHKYLPLPTNVRVTNLENGRSLVVRVNDRGPFPSPTNPHSGERIIDLSYGAARQLGFHEQGTARVLVETVPDHG